MICDTVQPRQYSYYRGRQGPFVITFYREDSENVNFHLYSRLKDLEKKFNDIPIIRFDYNSFKQMYKFINIDSPNHLLIVESEKPNVIIENTTIQELEKLFLCVREKRLFYRKKLNSEIKYKNRNNQRPWIVNSRFFRINDIMKFVNTSAEKQYKFPNSTVSLSLKIVDKQNTDINLETSELRMPTKHDTLHKIKEISETSDIKISSESGSKNLTSDLVKSNIQIKPCILKKSITKRKNRNHLYVEPLLQCKSTHSNIISKLNSCKKVKIINFKFLKTETTNLKSEESISKVKNLRDKTQKILKSFESNKIHKLSMPHERTKFIGLNYISDKQNVNFKKTDSRLFLSYTENQSSEHYLNQIKHVPQLLENSQNQKEGSSHFSSDEIADTYYSTNFTELFLQQLSNETAKDNERITDQSIETKILPMQSDDFYTNEEVKYINLS